MKRYELENLTGKHLNLYNMVGKYINNIPMSDKPVPTYEKGTEPCGVLRGIPLVTQDFHHIENLPEDDIYHATEEEARTFFTNCFGVDCEKESPKHLIARGRALEKSIQEAFPDLDYVYVDFQHIKRI